MDGNLLAGLAFAVVIAAGALWYERLTAVRAGEVRGVVIGAMALAALLATGAFVAGVGLGAGLAAGSALLVSGIFLVLQPFSAQSRHAPAVGVGDAILDFTAPDDAEKPFRLSSLSGRPYLLKFFRGHW